MYSEKQKNEFALLRAEGESFNSISKKLDIPIRTLFYWAKDMSGVISDLKIAAYESATDSLKASVNKRIQSLIITLHNNVIVLSYFWVFYFTKLLFYQFQKFFYMTFLLCSFYPVDYD